METFEFHVSLKVWHPSIDPAEISETIGIAPKFTHKAGMPKQRPNGTFGKGTYERSYWCGDLVEPCETSSIFTIENELAIIVDRLSSQKEFFSDLLAQGGQVQLWLSTHSTKNYCIQLPCNLMKSLSNVGLEVLIDVYPYPQNW